MTTPDGQEPTLLSLIQVDPAQYSKDEWRDRLRESFAQLDGGEELVNRKISVILDLALARAQGQNLPDRYWDEPGRPSKFTYQNWRKHDPAFVPILDHTVKMLRQHVIERAIDSVDAAVVMLQQATPQAVAVLIDSLNSSQPWLRFHAAQAILDRADRMTAHKKPEGVELPNLGHVLRMVYGKAEKALAAGREEAIDGEFEEEEADA